MNITAEYEKVLKDIVKDRTLTDNSGNKYMFLDDLEVIVSKCETMISSNQMKVLNHLFNVRIIDYKTISSHGINPIRYAAMEFAQKLKLKV